MFIPKRVFINPQSKHSRRTEEILARIHTYAPDAQIVNLPPSGFDYPEGMTAKQKFDFMKESVIISERVVPFIRTFPSPGEIVERITTVCNLTNMCCSNCEYCYLQNAQCPEHYIYTNRYDLEKELATSSYSHWTILTIWTMYSFGKQAPLMKLPEKLMEIADRLRESFVDLRIVSDRASIDYLYRNQERIYEELKAGLAEEEYSVPKKAFQLSRDEIKQFYDENRKYPLVLTISEFADIFAIDHLTGNMSFVMEILKKYPELHMTARTKSANVDEWIKYNGFGRMRISMGLNTEYVIDKYEHGTASLDERIDAAIKIQQAKGIDLSLVIAPMIIYERYEEDYAKLIDYSMTKLDPTKIKSVAIGSVRYRPQLRSAIQEHFPSTTLFNTSQRLQEPIGKDERFRYPVDLRVEIYSKMRDILKQYTDAEVTLDSENPEVWDRLKLDRTGKIGSTVYQYLGNSNIPVTPQIKPSAKKESEKKMTSKNPFSLAFRVARQSFIDNDQGIDEQKFEETEKAIEAMIEDENEVIGGVTTKVHEYDYWKDEPAVRKEEILKNRKVWTPVKIVGSLRLIGPYYPMKLDAHGKDDPEELTAVQLELKDLDGETVQCIPFPLEDSFVDIGAFIRSQQLLTLYGAIVPVSLKNKSGYRMYLRYISTEVDPEDLITKDAIKDFMDHPAIKFVNVRRSRGIIEYIKQQLVTGLGIKELDKLPDLDLALEFMILQSLSQGKEIYSHKLHSLIVGPPGVGKSYLTRAAKILNPLCDEISATSRKITAAGLIGSVVSRGNKSSSENGLLPKNSMGCVCIQDFHEIKGNKREEIFGIFSKVMEDGEVVDSTSARKTHIAQTSIHLDQNRKSQIYKKGEYTQFSDIDIPLQIISRFDFILDIPKDEQRQKELARTIARGKGSILTGTKWKAELKTIIAFLRSNYKRMGYASGIEKYRADKYDKLMDSIIEKYGSTVDISDMHTRLSRSIDKYMRAITTAYATDEATKEIVDYAFRFIEKKVEFLVTFSEQSQSQKDSDDRSLESIPKIFHELVPDGSSEDGKFYDTEEVFSRYAEKNNIAITERSRGTEKTKLSKLLKEHFGIEVGPKYLSEVKKTVRCYLLNNDSLKQLELMKDSQQPDEGKQPMERKNAKVKSRGFRDKGKKIA